MKKTTEEYVTEAFGDVMKRIKDRMMSPSKRKEGLSKMSDHVKTYVDHLGVKSPRRKAMSEDEIKSERNDMIKSIKSVTQALSKAKSSKGTKIFDIKPAQRPDVDAHTDYVAFSILFQLTDAYWDEMDDEHKEEMWHELSTALWPVIDDALSKAKGYKKSKGDWGFSYVKTKGTDTESALNVESDHKWRDIFLSGLVFWLKPLEEDE